MRFSSGLFIFLFVLWMGASTYWYVCKIKGTCSQNEIVQVSEKVEIDRSASEEMTSEEVIEDVKNKISDGYTIYYFPKNSVENNNIESAFEEFTDNLALFLEKNTEDKIEITGHTDDIGSDLANKKFGFKRADFIKNILIEKGILPNRIIIKSKGEKEPVASNETEHGKEQNRRVVIKLIDN